MVWYATMKFLSTQQYGLVMSWKGTRVENPSGIEFKTAFIIVLGNETVTSLILFSALPYIFS